MELVRPAPALLDSYKDALRRGWSPDTTRGADAAREALDRIEEDPSGLYATVDDPEGKGPLIHLPDGTEHPRLPGLLRWMWDGEGFAGSINLRWSRGHGPLPPFVLGHAGYSVVPWKRRRGYATQALAGLLPLARAHGMPFIDLTTDPDNLPSQRVITANGGVFVEHFDKGPLHGHKPGLRFRIVLDPTA